MTTNNNTNARNTTNLLDQDVHIAHIKVIDNIPIAMISSIVCELQSVNAGISCSELMTELQTEVYGRREDVEAIIEVLNRPMYAERMFMTLFANTEDREIELDDDTRDAIRFFRNDLNGTSLSGTDLSETSTADMVRILVRYGIRAYKLALDSTRTAQEGQ